MSYPPPRSDDDLAYGDDYSHSRAGGAGGSSTGGERSLLGSTFRKFKSEYDKFSKPSPTSQNYGYTSSGSNQAYYGPSGASTTAYTPGQNAPSPAGPTPASQPGQPTYSQQGQPLSAQPGQSIYSQPGQTSYSQPGQTTYSQPGQPLSSQPGQTTYSQPGQPLSSQPGQSTYSQPGQTTYSQPGQSTSSQPNQMSFPGGPATQQSQGKQDLGVKLLGTIHSTIHNIGTDVASFLGPENRPPGQYGNRPPGSKPPSQAGYATYANAPSGLPQRHRFDSFASEKPGNDVKWYVDGCGYFWAVSQALERARQSIWILDWWLSPELYLRRPPSQNEQWRLDRTLQRAAQRGVKVNIIVYKEVTQALTLSSAHTKHELEKLSPNIAVFRHPDHLPDAQTAQSSLVSSFQNLKLDAGGISRLGGDALKGIYGFSDDVILYWAHHEKLCLIDGQIAFMGGLDLCFGRWDTNQHAIADAHPTNVNGIVFPGQDFNNARVMDFSDVANPFQNKLDRTRSSRMGWSDIAVSLQGSCVQDLRHHFIDRWNFIYDAKYGVRKDVRYARINDEYTHAAAGPGQRPQSQPQPQSQSPPQAQAPAPVSGQPAAVAAAGTFPPPPGSQPYTAPAWQTTATPHVAAASPPVSVASTGGYQHEITPNAALYGGALDAPVSPISSPPPSQSLPAPYGAISPPPVTDGGYNPAPAPVAPQPGFPSPLPSETAQPYFPPPPSSAALQPGFPPPPAGPPPQSSPPPQGYSAYQLPPVTSPAYVPYHQEPVELPSSSERGYPQPGYQQSESEHARGLDDYAYGSNRGVGDYSGDSGQGYGGYGNENGRAFGESGGGGVRGRIGQYRDEGRRIGQELTSIGNLVSGGLNERLHQFEGRYLGGTGQPRPVMTCQMVRSCTTWSNGTPVEHSIQNAYIEVIRNSRHFVYIENQFFITATGDQQKPVKNLIGEAIVERILRAARNGEKYKMIVVIPAVPAFAGDLREDDSLGTRAIMEYQYFSINRGGHSIMEKIAQAGYNPMDYIRFYNLRCYDRINAGNAMKQAEEQSGVGYEDARRQHDDAVGAGYGPLGERTGVNQLSQAPQYQQYQTAAQNLPVAAGARWDTVSECYMLGGPDIRSVPWDGPADAELDAFVSEELYIHSKCLIADDRIVICGSANLNDRSQLGTHDSEIALVIEDPTTVASYMAGQPYQASRFAASLRRQLFRKHLGLIRPQNMQRPDANFEPVGIPNLYDWDCPEDVIVADPLSDTFQSLWNSRARTNTEVFRKAFRAVPDDTVLSWGEYKEFYEYFYHPVDAKTASAGHGQARLPPRVEYGHVVRADFPGGAPQLKELLSQVRGTLVEMPLCFLQNEDIAKQGLTLNALTEEVYT